MKKFKSVFKIDFTTSQEATDLYFNILRHGNITEAREAVRSRYGLATVHIVAATAENALAKWAREFNEGSQELTWTNYETIVCGNTI